MMDPREERAVSALRVYGFSREDIVGAVRHTLKDNTAAHLHTDVDYIIETSLHSLYIKLRHHLDLTIEDGEGGEIEVEEVVNEELAVLEAIYADDVNVRMTAYNTKVVEITLSSIGEDVWGESILEIRLPHKTQYPKVPPIALLR
jgi:hypothetical protein